jgi:hypothetical protein
MVLRLRGGGDGGRLKRERATAFLRDRHILSVAPGGLLYREPNLPYWNNEEDRHVWNKQTPKAFSVHLLDWKTFRTATDLPLPDPCVDELSYFTMGLASSGYFKHVCQLKAELKSTNEGREIYAKMKEGSPLKSLGELRNLSETSQPIKVIEWNVADANSHRDEKIGGLDKYFSVFTCMHIPDVKKRRDSVEDGQNSDTDSDNDTYYSASSGEEDEYHDDKQHDGLPTPTTTGNHGDRLTLEPGDRVRAL